jgi:hypothetical protein
MGQPNLLKTSYTSNSKRTGRTETSKYPEEEKINNDFPSSGERKGKSPNFGGLPPEGCRTTISN